MPFTPNKQDPNFSSSATTQSTKTEEKYPLSGQQPVKVVTVVKEKVVEKEA